MALTHHLMIGFALIFHYRKLTLSQLRDKDVRIQEGGRGGVGSGGEKWGDLALTDPALPGRAPQAWTRTAAPPSLTVGCGQQREARQKLIGGQERLHTPPCHGTRLDGCRLPAEASKPAPDS